MFAGIFQNLCNYTQTTYGAQYCSTYKKMPIDQLQNRMMGQRFIAEHTMQRLQGWKIFYFPPSRT